MVWLRLVLSATMMVWVQLVFLWQPSHGCCLLYALADSTKISNSWYGISIIIAFSLFQHAYNDGRLEDVVLRHLGTEDGSTVIAKDNRFALVCSCTNCMIWFQLHSSLVFSKFVVFPDFQIFSPGCICSWSELFKYSNCKYKMLPCALAACSFRLFHFFHAEVKLALSQEGVYCFLAGCFLQPRIIRNLSAGIMFYSLHCSCV